MKISKSWVLAGLLAAMGASGAEPGGMAPNLARVLSKVQSMGHGTYSDAEWQAVQAELDRIVITAEADERWNDAVEALLVRAMMLSDMKRDYQGALDQLASIRARYDKHRPPAMRKVYVREAQAYGNLGDDVAVRRVMESYKSSAYFDPDFYPYVAHEGRNTPVTVTRPGSAASSDSTALTAMRVAKQQARFAEGALFPDFTLTDTSGRERKLDDYRGKVLVVDFWVRGWTPWVRDLDNLKAMYRKYGGADLEILGVCLEPGASDVAAFATRQGLNWPQVAGEQSLSRQLGIYGGAANYVIGRDGQIVGRNLRGADLAAVVKQAMAP